MLIILTCSWASWITKGRSSRSLVEGVLRAPRAAALRPNVTEHSYGRKGWLSIYFDPQPTLSTFQVGGNRSTRRKPNSSYGTQPIEDFFGKIYATYSQSAKMQRDLKRIAAELEVQLRKVNKILTTRWVASSSRAVESFWRKLSCTLQAFPRTFTSHNKDKATYAGLAKRMETIEFVEDVAIMNDCLGQLSMLSESLQKDFTMILKASNYLQWTMNALEKIKDSLETKYEFKNIYHSSVEFKGVELKSFQSRRGYKSFNRKQFLQGFDW